MELAWKLQEQWEIISYILHEGVSICYKKKKEKGPETDFLFLKMILTFFKSIWILTITSLAIHYSENVFRSFSILVCIGVQGFFRGFFFLFFYSFSRAWLALALTSRLPPFNRKRLKNCACSADPGLLNEINGSWFSLSWPSSYQNEW